MLSEHTVDHAQPSVQKILRAAASTFGRDGYDGASLAAIARAAGVSKSLLHYHFDSKEHLFLEVQLLLCRDLQAQIASLTEGSHTLTHFRAALDGVLAFLERDLDQLFVLIEFRAAGRRNPRVAERLGQFHEELRGLAVQGIHNALGPLVEALDIPVERLGRLLLTIFHGLLVSLAFAEGEEARQLVRETFQDVQALLERALLNQVS